MKTFLYRPVLFVFVFLFFFQAEDGIRDAQESRGLGDVYKRQSLNLAGVKITGIAAAVSQTFATIHQQNLTGDKFVLQ